MESQYSKLCKLLDEALGTVAVLGDLLEEDFLCIRDLRMADLYASNKRKEGLESHLKQVEAKWEELSATLGRALGLPQDRRTLNDVANQASSPWSEELGGRRDRLSLALKGLRAKGEANLDLLTHSLFRIDESLNLLNLLMNPGAVYGSGGRLDPPGKSGSLLSSQV